MSAYEVKIYPCDSREYIVYVVQDAECESSAVVKVLCTKTAAEMRFHQVTVKEINAVVI